MGGCGMGVSDVVVALNRADTAQRVDLPMGMYRDLVTNTDTLGGSVELPPRAWRVLAPR
jgi:hypothetical protein